jgi:hypothetical protein
LKILPKEQNHPFDSSVLVAFRYRVKLDKTQVINDGVLQQYVNNHSLSELDAAKKEAIELSDNAGQAAKT